jgi:glyceraldehyde 3-phosphate dehydrogenase
MSQSIKIGINGFGRIGRKIVRLALSPENAGRGFQIVGINDLSTPEQIEHLFKYDSVHGTFHGDVKVENGFLIAAGQKIRLTAEKNPENLKWNEVGADFVHECTGIFTDKDKAALHLKAGAKRVIISAPSKDADATFCVGVNETSYNASQHVIVSNASCTTNCLAPMVKVIDEAFGVIRGTMLTVHSYTNDQNVLDLPHKDLRRARAAALSMIPTTTGAAKAVGLVLPHLKGKLDGLAIRVPTPNVSVVDFTAELKTKTDKDAVNAALKAAAQGPMKGILAYETHELVSCDFNGSNASSTIDSKLTSVLDGNFVKVVSWYDNETGFSQRMLDLTDYMVKHT